MATDVEALIYVQQNVCELRKLGKEWGLNESEINECVQKALSVKVSKTPASKTKEALQNTKFKARKSWSRCRCFLKICFSLAGAFLFVSALLIGYLMYETNSAYPSKFLLPYAYPVMRAIRLMGVPLQHEFRIEQWYNSECIVENPLFYEPPPDCQQCKPYQSVKQLKVKTDVIKPVVLSYPLLHREKQTLVQWTDLTTLIQQNEDTLKGQNMECSVDWARFTSDLLGEVTVDRIKEEKSFSCAWESKDRMFLSQLMRKLFPRPSFIPPEMEVTLQKVMYIDGPHSLERLLPNNQMGGYVWYTQGLGSRVVQFSPFRGCEDTCKTFTVDLNAGDILTYPTDRWKVSVLENGDDLSIGFVGNIQP